MNKKPNLHLVLSKLGRLLKLLEPFFFQGGEGDGHDTDTISILRPHSLEISMSLARVVGSSYVNP